MDWKLELIVVPVSDVDRAKTFYIEKVGFNLDVDHRSGDTFRVVQLTPPGSACSISIGTGITPAAPGSATADSACQGVTAGHHGVQRDAAGVSAGSLDP